MKKHCNQIVIYNARIIGILFLLAFLAYGFGRHLFFESGTVSEKYAGSILIIINSTIVLFIGILLKKTLQQYNLLIGNIYLLTRIFEAIALAIVFLNLIPQFNIPLGYEYFLSMFVLGLGSIPMCWVLFKHRITPKWLAIWGAIGYTVFAFGFLMEFFGKHWSMYLLAIGGLWEITFAIWLIINGRFNGKTINR